MHTEETVVVGDSANLASVSMFHACRSELPYDNDGLALVHLSGVLVGSGRNDLGQADRYPDVSMCIVRRRISVVLRGRLILDIMRRRRTVLLKGAPVRPGHCQHLKHAEQSETLTGQELVQAYQQLNVGVGRLWYLCRFVNSHALPIHVAS